MPARAEEAASWTPSEDIAAWGVDVVVSGRAIYDGTDPPGNLGRMLDLLHSTSAHDRIDAVAS